jgi:putative two-component system response regulator
MSEDGMVSASRHEQRSEDGATMSLETAMLAVPQIGAEGADADDGQRRIVVAGAVVALILAAGAIPYLLDTWDRPHRSLLLAVPIAVLLDVTLVLRHHRRIAAWPRMPLFMAGWNVAHIALIVVLCALDGGLASPFRVALFVSIAFAGVSLPRHLVALIAAINLVALLAIQVIASDGATVWSAGTWMMAAGLVATAVVCATVVDDRLRRLDALRAAKEELLRRLAVVVEHRDNDTGVHIERMASYCEVIARRLGLPDDEVSELRLASTMHDIGKVAIPDSVLLKPGPLTSDERTLMERHAVIGHDMLAGSPSSILQLAATIALTHHERHDGSGYPRGMAGEEIPLSGRIAAVADVFDALTSDRVYKEAIPFAEAVTFVRLGAGTLFHPDVVAAFLAAEDEIAAVFGGLQADADRSAWRRVA